MRIKPNCVKELMSMGISRKNAKAIQGQPGTLTGRFERGWSQVEFNGKLLKRKRPFVFCVLNTSLEF